MACPFGVRRLDAAFFLCIASPPPPTDPREKKRNGKEERKKAASSRRTPKSRHVFSLTLQFRRPTAAPAARMLLWSVAARRRFLSLHRVDAAPDSPSRERNVK